MSRLRRAFKQAAGTAHPKQTTSVIDNVAPDLTTAEVLFRVNGQFYKNEVTVVPVQTPPTTKLSVDKLPGYDLTSY